MPKQKTHFEQVPLKIVKKIAKIQPPDAAQKKRKTKKNGESRLTSVVDRGAKCQ